MDKLNLLNWFLGLMAVTSTSVTLCGLIKYFLVSPKNNKEKKGRAKKISIYGMLVLIATCIVYAILIVKLSGTPGTQF